MLKCSHLPLAETLKLFFSPTSGRFISCISSATKWCEGHPGTQSPESRVGALAEPCSLRNGPALRGINSLYNPFPSLKLANYNRPIGK